MATQPFQLLSLALFCGYASAVSLSCQRSIEGGFEITVADNGRGNGHQGERVGNGLRNMQYRATQLGGRFSFTSGVATLRLPAQLATRTGEQPPIAGGS